MRTPLKIFTGTAHPEFAEEIAQLLQIPLGECQVRYFQDGETYVKFDESVRGADCYIIQPTCPPVDHNLVQLLILLDALRRASAARITPVVPYFGYARQEKKGSPREPITAKLVADLIVTAGANRLMTMDLHADATQGFFNIPVDHLSSLHLFADYFRPLAERDLVVVSPDEGRVKKVRQVAARLGAPIAVGYKYHPGHDTSEVTHLAGEVRGKVPLIIEDIISTGSSVLQCVEALLEHGCRPEIYIAATHGVLLPSAIERLQRPEIAQVVVTNTVPIPAEKRFERLQVLTVAPLFAEAIHHAHHDLSVSSLFE